MFDCPPIPPPPSLFTIVSTDQSFGADYNWPASGFAYWVAAMLLLLLVLGIAMWVARAAPRGGQRRLTVALLAVGALAVLLPGLYLLLAGWPGTRLDTLWWFGENSAVGGSSTCLAAVNNIDHQHTLARDALNTAASRGFLGGAVLFTILAGVLASASLVAARRARRQLIPS